MQDHILEIKKFFPEAVCEKILLYFENYLEDAKVTNDDNPIQKNIRNFKSLLDSSNYDKIHKLLEEIGQKTR